MNSNVASWPLWSSYVRLWKFLGAHRRLLVESLVGTAGAALTTALFAALTGPCVRLIFSSETNAPWLTGRLGEVVRSVPPGRMRALLPIVLLGVAVVRGAFSYLQQSRMAELCLRAVADLQERLHRSILQLPLSFFQGRHSGEVYAAFGNDLGHVERALTQGLAYSVRDVFQLVALTCVCVSLDPRLFLLAGMTLPLGILVISRFGKALRGISVEMQETQAQLLSKLQDAVSGAVVLRVARAEGVTLRTLEAQEESLLSSGRRSAALRGAATPSVEFLGFAGVALVLLCLEMRLVNVPAEKMISFFGAVLLAYQPLKSLAGSGQWLLPGLTAADRLFSLLDTPPLLPVRPSARPLPAAKVLSLTFQSVTVRYGNLRVLDDLRLQIATGSAVALVGRSGAGKSTLLHLIPRLLDPSSGEVRVGEWATTEVTLASLRQQIALVGQEVFLFDATVAQNLDVGQKSTVGEMEGALRIAGALEFVRKLPHGIETRLGERGQTLSGGQRQRIALARAFLKRAPVLLLDEAMSALDPPLEAEILKRLTTVDRKSTLVAVTHRLGSAAFFDRVIVLDAGRVIEDGSFSDLLVQDGWFARAYQDQRGKA